MKHYPTQILLTVTDPKTGKDSMRWFPVNNEAHEKYVRGQIKAARASIATAREQMAKSIGTDAQKMVVENLRQEFVEFHRREAPNVDAKGSREGKACGNEGEFHPDSAETRPVGACGSGSGQTQGRESGQESPDGLGLREGCEEPIAAT